MKGIEKGRTAVSPLLWCLYINLNPVLRPPGSHFVLPHQPLPRNLNTDKLLPQSMRIGAIPICCFPETVCPQESKNSLCLRTLGSYHHWLLTVSSAPPHLSRISIHQAVGVLTAAPPQCPVFLMPSICYLICFVTLLSSPVPPGCRVFIWIFWSPLCYSISLQIWYLDFCPWWWILPPQYWRRHHSSGPLWSRRRIQRIMMWPSPPLPSCSTQIQHSLL